MNQKKILIEALTFYNLCQKIKLKIENEENIKQNIIKNQISVFILCSTMSIISTTVLFSPSSE